MSNFITRTISGAVFVVLVIGSILLHPYAFAGLFFIVSFLGLREFYSLHKIRGIAFLGGILAGSWAYLSLTLYAHHLITEYSFLLVLLNLLFAGLPFLISLFSGTESPFTSIALTLLGILYIPLPLALINFFFYTGGHYGLCSPVLPMSIFFLIWTNDTFAYLTGSWLGRHKLFERISPKKTWEGSAGGALFTLILTWILSGYFPVLSTGQWLVLAAVTIVFGTLGDLIESMMKRSLMIKDSGNLIPGHGGILDRFDATLAVAPVIFVLLYIFGL